MRAFVRVRVLAVMAALLVSPLLIGPVPQAGAQVRIKDVVSLQGTRENQLIGYGLVVGLNGSGDSLRNAPFAESSMRSMLDQLGIGLNSAEIRTRNVAAVLVTAELPPYANKGMRVDVHVASIGDATSLRGGTLVFSPLYGGDGKIYASAQGRLIVSGFSAEGDASDVDNNTPTASRIPNGGIVERPAPGNLEGERVLVLNLSNPDFDTAIAITDRINEFTSTRYNQRLAREIDHQSVKVSVPAADTPARFFASIGRLTVQPDTPARIIVDERTGTVIIGANVKVSKVAITHGGLTVSVVERPIASQPEPFSEGETVVLPDTEVGVLEQDSTINIVDGPDLQQLVNGLNMMGANPSAIIAILQAIKSAGALQADLVVQ
jgi:flagellar P-ring protein FlgI